MLHAHRRSVLKALTVALVAVMVVAACGGGSSSNDFTVEVYRGQEVLRGQNVRFSDILAQGKPVVLNFWAGLCPPCRAEMPDLQQVYADYRDRVTLLGLDVGPFVGLGTKADAQALLRDLNITYPTGTTSEGKVVRSYQVFGMPTTLFMKPTGEIVRKWTGPLSRSKATELMEELLAKTAH